MCNKGIDNSSLPGKELLNQVEQQLFFIIGCGRSGTSLLQAMVASHPQATLPHETGFYTTLYRTHPHLHSLDNSSDFQKVIDIVMNYRRIRALNLDEGAVRSLCALGDRSWETIFLAILAQYARERKSIRVGEKSPGHIAYLNLLSERFPHAKFIHMIRDPRGVIYSKRKARFGGPFIWAPIQTWQRAIYHHRNIGARLGANRYLSVRYEDLVSDPENSIRQVCELLSLEFHSDMLTPEKRQEKGFASWQESHMSNTLRPIFTSSVDRWRQELGLRQIALIEHTLGTEMSALNYKLTHARTLFPNVQIVASKCGVEMYTGVGRVVRMMRNNFLSSQKCI